LPSEPRELLMMAQTLVEDDSIVLIAYLLKLKQK
jgi:hypothetical protein